MTCEHVFIVTRYQANDMSVLAKDLTCQKCLKTIIINNNDEDIPKKETKIKNPTHSSKYATYYKGMDKCLHD